jgi:hypothetical protein
LSALTIVREEVQHAVRTREHPETACSVPGGGCSSADPSVDAADAELLARLHHPRAWVASGPPLPRTPTAGIGIAQFGPTNSRGYWMTRPVSSTARAWWLVAATLVIAWLTHYVVVIQHEYAHSFMAWVTGIKDDPIRIAWGGTGIHNISTLGNIDEDVDYDRALAGGHTTAAALTAMAGVVIGNGVFYLVARRLLWRAAVAGRVWVLYSLFWYIVHSVGNFYNYVPLRTFAAGGDVNNFTLATGWSRWWVYGVAGYLTLWAIVDLYQKALPMTLGAAAFERVRPARAIVLVLSTLVLFVLYALPALEQADPVSVFMGWTSLIIIPAVLIATWRRNVVSELPLPPGRQVPAQRTPVEDDLRSLARNLGHR